MITRQMIKTESMTMVCLLFSLISVSTLIAAEPEVAWQIDFDGAEKVGGVHYVVRDGHRTDKGMKFEIANGVLTFGAVFDSNSGSQDHGLFAWGKSMPWGFWQWKSSLFEKIDASKFPILEVRARKAPGFDASVILAPTFDTDSGRRFSQLALRLTDKWKTFTFRLSALSSVPGPTTPRSITGMAFWLQHNHKPSGLQIDWVRVRAFTPEEKARDEVTVNILGTYKIPHWKQSFFVYGPYGATIRGGACEGGFEGAYRDMAHAHMNYLMCPHDISYYRFQGRKGKTQKENVSDFLEVNRRVVNAAHDMGMTLSIDVRGFSKDFNNYGLDYIRPGVQMVADAFRGNETVIGYTIDDEPNTNRLIEVVAVKKLFEAADPTKLCAFAINGAYWAPDFKPYTTVLVADSYPITLTKRNVSTVSQQMEKYNVISNRPIWFIIQAIGEKSWWPAKKEGFAVPTDAEFLRMAFMTLEQGAKGLMFYDWYHHPWQTLVDRFGNPGPLYEVASNLGERLAAVGSILLRAQYDKQKTNIYFPHNDITPFNVSFLSLPGNEKLFIASNRDLEHSHTLDMKLPPPLSKNIRMVMNLDTLLIDSNYRLHATNVAPGNGQFFVLGRKDKLESLKAEIISNRRRETQRVSRINKVIAKRWGNALGEMKNIDVVLDMCAVKLGEVEKKVSAGMNGPKAALKSQWSRWITFAKRYDNLRFRWITANKNGLAKASASLKQNVTSLAKEVSNK